MPFNQLDMFFEATDEADASPEEWIAAVEVGGIGRIKAQFGGANVAHQLVEGEVYDGGRLLGEVFVNGQVIGPTDVAIPGPHVAPEESEGRPAGAGFGQFALQQPVVDGVGVEGDTGEKGDGRDDAG